MQTEDLSGRFYSIQGDRSVLINKINVLKFWESKGFRKLLLKNGGYQLIKISNGSIIEEIEDFRLMDEVRDFLEVNEPNFDLVFDEFLKKDFVSKGLVKSLKSIKVSFNYGNQNEAYFFYNNCVVKVTKDAIEKVNYEDYEGYIWKKQIIQRKFEYNSDYKNSEFAHFLYHISGSDRTRFESLRTITGFLIHSYKNPSFNPAVILIDEDIDLYSEEAKGGKGKSLYARGIGQVIPMYFKEGKNISKSFPFSGFENHHRLMFYDDVKKDFDFENLFSIITGDFNVEKKYKNEEIISFSESPKILISTNYMMAGVRGFSSDRRKLEFEVSSFYGKHRSPKDQFGHLLFDDWSNDQWSLYDSLMMEITKEYLNKGVMISQSINLEENKLKSETNPKLVEFMDEKLKEKSGFIKKELFNEFRNKYNPEFFGLTPIQFGKWINIYGEYKGFMMNERKSSGNQIVEFLKIINNVKS